MNHIYSKLLEAYGPRGWWPVLGPDGISIYKKEFSLETRSLDDAYEIALGAILTQNTAWTNVEKALSALKKKTGLDKTSIKVLDDKDLALLVRPAGYYNQKVKKIRVYHGFLDGLKDRDIRTLKELPAEKARTGLLDVWGIGPETADSILLYAAGVLYFVVDAYTRRILGRCGIIGESISYHDIQNAITTAIPADLYVYREFHALLVHHAKLYCRTRPDCSGCPLADHCRAALTGRFTG